MNRRNGQVVKKILIQLLCFGFPLFILLMPADWMPLAFNVVEKRLIAIFFFAALCWILEPIPIHATSIMIILLELFLISDAGIQQIKPREGILLDYKAVLATFASPIIMLFLGGFFLAKAAQKYRLDLNLARILLKPFGTIPRWVMMGLMIITALFSMFMSNTATTVMMLSILVPILGTLPKEDRGRTALALSIPFAANIGGVGTPIGTPPNAIALKYLTGENQIGFGEWMGFAVPYAVVLLIIAWGLLITLFPFESKSIELKIRSKWLKTTKAKIVYITFIVTILLWLTDFWHGMNAYVVAILPVAVFLATNVINTEDMKKLSWDILWLVSGGIALGYGLEKSGLAVHLVASIPFDQMPVTMVLIGMSLLAMVMANFMSNTATANLLLPIVAALAVTLPGISAWGGSGAMILGVALASSMGMALPISTPPNALAHATGETRTNDMSKVGILVGVIGLAMIIGLLWLMAL
ncbi:MAG: SLC13 family permease [Bacteroidota bacterium]